MVASPPLAPTASAAAEPSELPPRLLGMKRKAPGDPPPVVPVRLYLEDVRALYDELAAATGEAHIEEYELDGPDDLLNLGRDRLSTLTLRGDINKIIVSIGRQGAWVRRWSPDAQVIVGAQNLRQMLLGCRRRLHWLFSWWANPLWSAVTIAGFILAFAIEGRAAKISGLVLMCLALLGFLGLLVMRLALGSVVHLRHRRDSPSFLKRNSDTLIVTGGVSLLTAVVTFLLTYFYLTPTK
jgi:hypothetical protein